MEALIDQRLEQEAQREPAARTTARGMFKYSEYVHVGEGATECPLAQWCEQDPKERGEMPRCEDSEHFHAWCRLPNPFQHEDIRKKALAAKARRLREFRDAESDVSVVLDAELSDINDPMFLGVLIDEIVAADWAENYLEAQREVHEREEFEHIEQDREELERLRPSQEELPEDERSGEFRQIAKHVADYVDAVRTAFEATQEPKRAELGQRSVESIVALVRSKRVDEEATKAFMDAYDSWSWFVGTFKVAPHPTLGWPHAPRWEEIGVKDRPSPGTMFGEAPEVIEALKATFNALQIALQRGVSGN